MFEEESIWIKQMLTSRVEITSVKTILDVGSSTYYYRNVVQPFIERNIFSPMRKHHKRIFHLDGKKGEGVDIVCDTDNLSDIQKSFDVVLAANLLEHVVSPQKVIVDLLSLLNPGGYIIVTVPYRFVYHKDPIDTMYRPNIKQLEGVFEGCDIIESKMLVIRPMHLRPRLRRLYEMVRLRSETIKDLPILCRRFKISCLLARKCVI